MQQSRGSNGGRSVGLQRDPATGLLPQLVGMNWILEQNDDPTSPYYHRLDTTHIGAAGHSEGGFATSTVGSDAHIQAIATMAGATAAPRLHEPALFLCGGQDTVVPCASIQTAFGAVTSTPVMLEENPTATHGSWIGSIRDPYQVAVTDLDACSFDGRHRPSNHVLRRHLSALPERSSDRATQEHEPVT